MNIDAFLWEEQTLCCGGFFVLHHVMPFIIECTLRNLANDTDLVVWWTRWREGMDPKGPGQAGEEGLCKPLGVQQGPVQGAAPWVGAIPSIKTGWARNGLKAALRRLGGVGG